MEIKLNIPVSRISTIQKKVENLMNARTVWITSIIFAVLASAYAFSQDIIVTYGDAESHLNIAKRVVHSITPGAAQLGGIWLPLPHILLVPFVSIDFLWRTGLAGAIVSGASYILSSVFLYKTAYYLTKHKLVSCMSFLVFALNPNVLYLQATPMTELVLILFFILSTYYFIQFLHKENIVHLIAAAFFGFCATLSRYDGWFLVLFQAGFLGLYYLIKKKKWHQIEGSIILYSSLAFFGVALWMIWDYLILGDPFYFTNSQFSAKTQQMEWLRRGELPAYHNFPLAFLYYFITSLSNAGIVIFLVSLCGLYYYLKDNKSIRTLIIIAVLCVPFIFNVVTMTLGQSVIFIPHLTPTTFEWTLFNVRYGVMMVPVVAFFFGYLFMKKSIALRSVLICLFLMQMGLYLVGYSKVISLADGTIGLSRSKRPHAEQWIKENYDEGLVLMDDYARTLSIVRSGIPMQNIIYIGNQNYWEESFYEPEKYATWIVMQRDDAVWNGIYEQPLVQGRLFKYFDKVYTSPDILIFKRNNTQKVLVEMDK